MDIGIFHLIHIHLVTPLFLQGSDSPVGETTGIDIPEVVQLSVDVQGESMHGHEMRTTHSDCTNLAKRASRYGSISFARNLVAEPYSSGSGDSSSIYAEISDCVDHALFECMDILFQPHSQSLQVENRISYQLAGAVIGDVSASVDSEIFCPDSFEKSLVDQQIVCMAAFAQCVNMRMFAKQQLCGGFLCGLLSGRALGRD